MDTHVKDSIRLECLPNILAIQEAVEMLAGKWRIAIIVTLNMRQELCFKDLKAELPYISAKVLAHELRFLEENKLITRVEGASRPIKVLYSLSDYGHTLDESIFSLLGWGLSHRLMMLKKKDESLDVANYVSDLRNNLSKKKIGTPTKA